MQQVSTYYKTIGCALVHNIERQQRDAEEQARYRAESQAAKELQERRMDGIQNPPRGTQRSCSVYYQLNQDSIVKCGNVILPIRLYLTNGWKVIQQQPGRRCEDSRRRSSNVPGGRLSLAQRLLEELTHRFVDQVLVEVDGRHVV